MLHESDGIRATISTINRVYFSWAGPVFIEKRVFNMKKAKNKSPSLLSIMGFVFSLFALAVTVWLLFFETPESRLLDQTVYWFIIALVAAIIPNIKQFKWKDIEFHLKEIKEKVDSNRRFANEIFVIDNAGNIAMVYRDQYEVWIPCGTRLELYEQPHEAVYRAIYEELGLNARDYEFWPKIDYPEYEKVKVVPVPYQVQEEYRTHRDGVPAHYDFIYVCTVSKEKPKLKEDPNLTPKWVSLDQLTKNKKEKDKKTLTFEDVIPTLENILNEMEVEKSKS